MPPRGTPAYGPGCGGIMRGPFRSKIGSRPALRSRRSRPGRAGRCIDESGRGSAKQRAQHVFGMLGSGLTACAASRLLCCTASTSLKASSGLCTCVLALVVMLTANAAAGFSRGATQAQRSTCDNRICLTSLNKRLIADYRSCRCPLQPLCASTRNAKGESPAQDRQQELAYTATSWRCIFKAT
eukprot:8956-Heterococcus_DN1.PRE.1